MEKEKGGKGRLKVSTEDKLSRSSLSDNDRKESGLAALEVSATHPFKKRFKKKR